jgi:hypothetical protein
MNPKPLSVMRLMVPLVADIRNPFESGRQAVNVVSVEMPSWRVLYYCAEAGIGQAERWLVLADPRSCRSIRQWTHLTLP